MAFVDKVFTDWQRSSSTKQKLALDPGDTLIPHFNVPLSQVINIDTRLCYSYS
ncbi:hypothetical protein DSO57_1001267 [Entomophthora muscae]|uniref:Uncharacterized protein n=1 Tax=Entomophthora muscae TaxID=34485 RepID=A0ACC2T8M5_9FUNG|nr:hypothetical protein DSO57_1001267 [Entomophthora muscae]